MSAGAGSALALVLCVAAVAPAGARPHTAAVPDTVTGLASDSTVRAELEGRPIRRVDVRCLDIFDPVPSGFMSPAYRLANRLHLRTRPRTVRAQLLFAPGEPWRAERLLETTRQLRDLEYLEPEHVRSRAVGDSVDVEVVTRDQWTTHPELNLERGGGRTYGAIGFTERNLLGLGIGLSFAVRNEPAGHSHSLDLQARHVFASPLEAQFHAGTGSAGVTNAFSLREPFRSLDDTQTWGVSGRRSNTDQMLFYKGEVAARFPFETVQYQVEYGVGERRASGLVRRATLGLHVLDRHYGVTAPEPGAPAVFPGERERLDLHFVSGRVTLWQPRFIERRGVEMFDPIEDFDVGALVSLETGLALRSFGSTADEGLVRMRLDAGRETRRFGFGWVKSRFTTRLRGGILREAIGHFDARWVQQPRPDMAIVVAAMGEASQNAPREQQVVIGGLNGLRGYGVQALAGTQALRLNAETRWVALRDVWDLASIGGAVFVDAARAWSPVGDREPWHHDAGFGLRLSFPHASLHQVARFDVAFPLSPTRDGRRSPVFSFGSSQAF